MIENLDHIKKILAKVHEIANGGGYTCNRGPRPSGARIVTSNGLIFWGNVVPPVENHGCISRGCMLEDGHCVRNNHAEVDAIIKCAKYGAPTVGAVMYSINKPCYACTRAIIAAEIAIVYYSHAVYDEERTSFIVNNSNLEMIHVK